MSRQRRAAWYSLHSRSLLLIGACLILITIQPFLWRLVKGRAEALNERQSTDQQVVSVDQRNQEIAADVAAQTPALNEIEQVAPTETELTSLIDELEQRADQQQINHDITNIVEQPDPVDRREEPRAPFTPVIVSLQAQGTPNNLLHYLDRIEQMSQLAVVTRVTLTPAQFSAAPATPPATNQNTYTMSLDVTFFLSQLTHASETAG